MKSFSIIAMLALLSTASANGHPDHEMAYYSSHPGKMTNSHHQRDTPFEPITEEETVEAAKLG